MAGQKDYDVFANKYPMDGELEQQNDKIEAMHKLVCCRKNHTYPNHIYKWL
ncbi:hypothetical protein Q4Q35_00030 [Flavivirga aquimarina]|uniref:Transposase n=1 Tax=Flavivirga aquimarina TaxID=2027862 RepID=A0ABT8W4Y8_9FLAO|nr:hypothetical protein [Flavivirga aquimarina]MDO5968183.1 hypothetical protein [Flavivirga aquimarina]